LDKKNYGDRPRGTHIRLKVKTKSLNDRISTSGLKSDVTIVFLSPDFLKHAKISVIRIHLRQIDGYLTFAWIFGTSWPKIGVGGGNRCHIDPPPQRTRFYFWGF